MFISSKHERVALELELTSKTLARVKEKVYGYRELMSARKDQKEPVLHRVFLIPCLDRIGKELQALSEYDNRVTIISYEALVGGALGLEALK